MEPQPGEEGKDRPLFAVHSLETARPLGGPSKVAAQPLEAQGGGHAKCSAAGPSLLSTWPGAPPCCGLHTTCWQPLKLHGGWQPPELSAPHPGAAVPTVENINARGCALGASLHLAHREGDALEGLLVTRRITTRDKGL